MPTKASGHQPHGGTDAAMQIPAPTANARFLARPVELDPSVDVDFGDSVMATSQAINSRAAFRPLAIQAGMPMPS